MKNQFMPMFWGDFFANTLHLSAQEIGAYVLLIAHAWEHNAEIETADAQRIARVDNRNWSRVRLKLAPFFEPKDGLQGSAPRAVHPRVSKELHRTGEISNKRKAAAEQMLAKKRANAPQLHYTKIESSNGKGRKTLAANYRDPGPDYRAPPRTKSNNVLAPLLILDAKRKDKP